MAERPPSPWPKTEGFESVAEPDPVWRVMVGKPCRSTVFGRARACAQPSVAEMNRGRRMRDGRRLDSWWAYCPEHTYGRWVEGGEVMHWILREKRDDA